MAINIGKLLKDGLSSLVGAIPGVGPIVQKLLEATDKAMDDMTPADRLALEKLIMDGEMTKLKLLISDNADFRKQCTAEIQSDDAFVRRVRPANLWLWVITFAFWLVVFPLLRAAGFDVNIPDLNIIPSQGWYTYIALFLGYGTMREIGKNNKLRHGINPE